jgi:hypothetical protein
LAAATMPGGRSRRRRFLRRPHHRLKLQQVDFRQHGRAPWCALTVSGQGGAFGSLAAAALRAGASADSGILSRTKNFFAKTSFTQRLPPLWAETIFGQVFVRGGMSNFQNPRVPPTGGRVCRTHIPARLRCAEPCQFRPAVPATGTNLISPEVAEPVG